jgi:hypothetical protein
MAHSRHDILRIGPPDVASTAARYGFMEVWTAWFQPTIRSSAFLAFIAAVLAYLFTLIVVIE